MARMPTRFGPQTGQSRPGGWSPSILPPSFVRPAPKRPVLIDTERFRLRSLAVADVDAQFCSWFADPDMLRGLNLVREEWTAEAIERRIQALAETPNYLFGIFTRPGAGLIGYCSLDINPRQRTAEMTAAIGDKAWRGQRVLAEIGRPLIRNFMEHGGVDKVIAHVLASNRKVLFELIGSDFYYEARLREAVLLASGKREDLLAFAVLKSISFPDLCK
ncbi:GNAT family N-acetyltransferase [Labrys monachus]|uniref:RimJ/RimL family protein N-acetyltransferase n=1 Tax=Labrys monachus TaxID=217067 RepID=A0ABU0FL55_9HYPH|nr:GNAT family N-acetyltransferase [Labrys monachus]MDQ0395336.1 RimJ/RimL family protein N-acetyltransferase [Labrys monachus]